MEELILFKASIQNSKEFLVLFLFFFFICVTEIEVIWTQKCYTEGGRGWAGC